MRDMIMDACFIHGTGTVGIKPADGQLMPLPKTRRILITNAREVWCERNDAGDFVVTAIRYATIDCDCE